MSKSGIDWEDAFSNGDYIPNSAQMPDQWASLAQTFRDDAQASGRADIDVAYGPNAREQFDIFWPDGPVQGVVVFVHGGYWLAFDKSSWSHLATGPLQHGWAVAMPSYTLAPQARIAQITAQLGQAITKVGELVEGPIRLAGHSAGGHLVSRAICSDGPLSQPVTDRIDRVVSISGLHDLRPLRLHSMNAQLQLDQDEAKAESPALQPPVPGIDVWAWVGAQERPEFLRQSSLLTEAWQAAANAKLVVEPERHHFNVIDGLADPEHPLTELLTAK